MTTIGLRVGRYEVGERLGKGGFGVVHIARDIELGREVAIKFLRPEYMTRLNVVQRFLQEARASAKIGHPGIVTVFECGQIQGVGARLDGTAYIVMERLYGESLGDRISTRGRLPSIAAIGIARQLAAALHVAHDAGIIHRDLKPDNVFLVKDAAVVGGERVKILDFGVAKLSDPDPDENPNTHSQMMLGTPRYMSPEQARAAAKVDHRTDIYALGCLLYELVCGKPPFSGDVGDVLIAHQTAPITPPREIVTSIPAALDELIVRMLAKDPDARPPTMRAVDDALDGVYSSLAPKKRAKTAPDEEKTIPREPPTIPEAEWRPMHEESTIRHPANVSTLRPDDDDKTTRRVDPNPLEVALETPMSLEATMVRRPIAPWWRWRFAIGAAAAVLSGVIVFLLLRKPSAREPARGSAPTLVPPDATREQPVAVVGPDAAPPADDLTSRLSLRCKQAQFDKNWGELEDCGRALAKTTPVEGNDYVAKASREARNEIKLRELSRALEASSFRTAAKLLEDIPADSVYRNAAVTAFDAAKGSTLDIAVRDLNVLSAARDCAKHAAKLRQLEQTYGPEIADEARLVARPCKAGTTATPPPPDPGLPTPLDACDKATVEAEERRGDSSLSVGNFSAALAAFESVVKCRPEIVRKAYLAACRTKAFPKAKRYWKLAGSNEALAQICMKEGYDPRR
jgi:serine/threonine protein kinase